MPRLTGSKLEGQRFEKSLSRFLMKKQSLPVLSQTWVRYLDEDGEGLASPDIVVPEMRLIVECKRTFTVESIAQLVLVYLPLCQFLWSDYARNARPWKLVSACKFWSPEGGEQPLLYDLLSATPGINFYIHRG